MGSGPLWVVGTVLAVVAGYTLYLNLLATFVIRYSTRLDRFQRISQTVFVWTVPLVGALLVLHLLFLDAPETLPRSWIPWPFKKAVYGPPIKPNPHRSDARFPWYRGHR